MNPANPNADPTQQDPALDQGVLSSLQVPGSPNHDSSFAFDIPAWVQLTDAIYWASKPPAVQALQKLAGMPPNFVPGQNPAEETPRYLAAKQLAVQGYVIDVEIDGFGNDPVVTMLLRTEMNFSQTQAAMGPAMIKTSLVPADYPPYPIPPAPTGPTNLVGKLIYDDGVNSFFAGQGSNALAAYAAGTIKNAKTWTEGGRTYTVHVQVGLMGETISFSLPD